MKNPVYDFKKCPYLSYVEMNTPYTMTRRHYHDSYEIFFMLEGERYVLFDDKKYLVKKGNIFVMEPFLPHATSSSGNSVVKRYVVNISPSDLSPLLSDSEISNLFDSLHTCILTLNEEKYNEASLYFQKIHMHKRERIMPHDRSFLAEKLIRMHLAELIYLITREIREHSVSKLEAEIKKNEAPVMNALRYINLNSTENISLDFISDYVHMSKSNFCLVFKKVVGETFLEYLNTLRVANVHKLLLTTDMPLGRIAVQTGFSSVDYMTRTFKKIHGMPPSAVRRANSSASSDE